MPDTTILGNISAKPPHATCYCEHAQATAVWHMLLRYSQQENKKKKDLRRCAYCSDTKSSNLFKPFTYKKERVGCFRDAAHATIINTLNAKSDRDGISNRGLARYYTFI